jgi:hypothetical protein
VYLSVCLSVRMSARCHWSTVFYLKKGSKTPEATSDLARKNDKKTKRLTSPGAAILQGGGGFTPTHKTHTHIPRAMWEMDGVEFFQWQFQFNFLVSAGFEPWIRIHDGDECTANIPRSSTLPTTL